MNDREFATYLDELRARGKDYRTPPPILVEPITATWEVPEPATREQIEALIEMIDEKGRNYWGKGKFYKAQLCITASETLRTAIERIKRIEENKDD